MYQVWDVDGKEYFDYLSAYSAVNQGHCHPKVAYTRERERERGTRTRTHAHISTRTPEFFTPKIHCHLQALCIRTTLYVYVCMMMMMMMMCECVCGMMYV